MTLPSPQAPVVDSNGKITPIWFRWLSELRGSADASAPQSDVDAAIAAIATALGSPDGTVASIPPQSEADIRLLQGAGIAITGDAANGYAIAIRPLADSGTGALLGIIRDSFGRVSGTTDATITGTAGEIDVADGDAVAGPPTLSLADVTDAGGGSLLLTTFDSKGRQTGSSAATASDVPIVDAGGYFTGTDVEAALQELGAGGGGGGGGYAEGASNPGSPALNDKFYRTDLNLLIYYDGTRWLTVQEYALPMGGGMDHTGNTTATPNTQARWPVRSDYGVYLTRWAASTLIVTTNTGSAFWTVALRWTNAANTQTTLVSFNTSADAPTNWIHHDQAINAVLDAAAVQIQTVATKTGAPGAIYCTSQLFGRLIVP